MHQFRRIRIDRRLFVWVGLIIAMLVILVPSWSARNDESLQIQLIVGDRRYDFVSWEIATLFNKAEAALIRTHHLLDGDAQQAVVLDYLDLVTERQWATYELSLLMPIVMRCISKPPWPNRSVCGCRWKRCSR